MAVSCDRLVRTLRDPALAIDVAYCTTRGTAWRVEERRHGREIVCPVNEDPEHALNRLWSLVGDGRERGVYTHVVAFGGVLPMLGGPVFAAWLGVPLLTLIRGNDFDAGIFSLRRGDVLRAALAASAWIGAVSRDKVERISALFPGVPVEWTPNGIDLADWVLQAPDREQAAAWRQARVSPGRRVIGVFGQLKRKKGGLFFLDALLASGRAADVHILWVGDTEPELVAALAESRRQLEFTVLPFMDRYELLPYYAACDWIALPSFYDGLPNVLLEAAGLGVPVLAARTGGMRDLLRDGENAVLFAPGDSVDCARAIDRALQLGSGTAQQLAERARQLVVDQFNHLREAERYREILRRTARAPTALPSCTRSSEPPSSAPQPS